MQKFFVLLQKEFIENWKTRKLILILASIIILGAFVPFYADATHRGDPLIFPLRSSHMLFNFVEYYAYVIAILIPFALMSTVAREVKDGLAAAILVKPVGRGAYILSKFAVSYLLFAVAVIAGFSLCFVYALSITNLYDPAPVSSAMFFQCLGFLLLYTAFAVALTIFLSSVFNNNVLAGGIAVVLLIAIYGFSYTNGIKEYMPSEILRWSLEQFIPGRFQANEMNAPYWFSFYLNIGLIPALIGSSVALIRKKEL
ncbi:MAG: ABC transporter permease [Dehalococcoidia bacterium]|nr:ABC transporter permease [Dehalococcoidia bacterium]